MKIKVSAFSRTQALLVTFVAFAVGLVADLWTKQWAWDTLREGKVITVIQDWFYFRFGFNTGAAFSFLGDSGVARPFFIAISALMFLYLLWQAYSLVRVRWYGFIGIGLILSGIVGNVHDRFVRTMTVPFEGHMTERYGVVDFIQVFYWPDKAWPTFNIADVAIVVGIGLLLIYMRNHVPDPKKAEA